MIRLSTSWFEIVDLITRAMESPASHVDRATISSIIPERSGVSCQLSVLPQEEGLHDISDWVLVLESKFCLLLKEDESMSPCMYIS